VDQADDDVPLPARCGFWAVPGGVAVEVVTRSDTVETRRTIERRLNEQRVPVRALHLVQDRRQLQHPLPMRCDLREAAFTAHEPVTLGADDEPARSDGSASLAVAASSTPGGMPWT
jgi:hypothetical protein